jgi:glycosyltransferase involved in cell wall biosynthesis
MTIYIPTYKRLAKQKTIKWLSKFDLERTNLIVLPKEEKAAVRLYGKTLGGVLVCKNPGVAAARQFALEKSPTDKVIFFDDDLQFCQRVKDWCFNSNNRALRPIQEDVDVGVDWLYAYLSPKMPVTCLGPRGGNNHIENRWHIRNGRIMRSFGVYRPILDKHNIRFDEFYYWEDFHVAVSLLELGYPNIVNVDCITGGDTNSAGGVYRNVSQMWDYANLFVQRHPTARIREKFMQDGDNITGADKIKVPDLTVYWKKSFGTKL